MNDELGRVWMEMDEAQSRYYPETHAKTQDSRCPGRDSNQQLLEYRASLYTNLFGKHKESSIAEYATCPVYFCSE
jgi:hypothetical protein